MSRNIYFLRYGIQGSNLVLNKGKFYADRAKERREKHSLDVPGAENTNQITSEESKARKMMEKMGWKEGKGLGREEKGITEPVRYILKILIKKLSNKTVIHEINFKDPS